MLEPAGSDSPRVHLFDEPQFNTQDGYIRFHGAVLPQIARRRQGGVRVPASERVWHVDILRETGERFIFIDRGRLTHASDFAALEADEGVRSYRGRAGNANGGDLLSGQAGKPARRSRSFQ